MSIQDVELTACPACGAPAEVIDRFVLSSTHGPVEHVKTSCITGHWFVEAAPSTESGRSQRRRRE
jgi:hypothetical protein